MSTSEARVDMLAESTSSMTRIMIMSGSVMSMEGTIESKSRRPLGRVVAPNSRPNPPRK